MTSSPWFKMLRDLLTRPTVRRPIRRTARLQFLILEDRVQPSASPALSYGELPLAFEANQGQAATQVDFLARGEGYALALTPSEAVIALRHDGGGDIVRLQFLGANPSAKSVGHHQLVTTTNYLLGTDPSQWKTGIPNYGKVVYQDVYAGIDLLYYGNQGQLEYDFVVAPGVDPGIIAMSVQGAENISLDASGNLVLHTSGGDLVQQAPVIYQEVGGVRQAVAGEFVLEGTNGVGFRVGAYDTSRTLVIDPVLSYSTYLGGSSADSGQAIAVDANGNAYITGYTYSANFPTTAGPQGALGGDLDVFVAKLNASGTGLVYSTYLGGTFGDEGKGIAVDASGNAYITGNTDSNNFPTTAGAFQVTNSAGNYKGFVAKLNATGSALVYSTYLGGSGGWDEGRAIAVDTDGNAYVTGHTASSDFPTQNPLQPIHADVFEFSTSTYYSDSFVTKLNASGASLVYSTFLGGYGDERGDGIAVDSAGNAYVTGFTNATDWVVPLGYLAFPTTAGAFQTTNASTTSVPFVTKLNAAGSALDYSTYLGGTTGYHDWAAAIAVDAAGSAYVTGTTQAADFPTTDGAYDRNYGGGIDSFVSKLNPSGSALAYSTFLGGSNTDQPLGIAVNAAGSAHVVGITGSTNFPTTANALQQTKGGGNDAFVTKLNASGSALVHSTYLGGSGEDYGLGIAVDSASNAYVVGETASTNFPTTASALQQIKGGSYDAFVAKLDMTEPPPPSSMLSIGDATVTEGNSGTRTATFTVTRSGDTSAGVSVGYATANGTALAGADYQAASGTLTFSPGETSRTITVTLNGDRLAEPNETFVVNLGTPTTGGVADGQGAGTILDDEPRISISDVTMSEGGTGATTLFTFTVTLSVAYDQAVTMSFRTVNGTATTSNKDYVARTGTLTFLPGETTKTITIEVKGDSKKEADEYFYLDLSGNSSNSLFTKNRGIGTILNDD